MTDLTLYGLKNCDTCKKAGRRLKAQATRSRSSISAPKQT
jgi:arsenate reductase-like glutaredoxin family protein